MPMDEEKKGKGFVVRDRRAYLDEEESEVTEEAREEAPEKEEEAKEPPGKPEKDEEASLPPLPEVNFSTFVISLATAAFQQMGLIEGQGEEEPSRDLQLAKHTIDTLAMMDEKTRGNLSQEEERLLAGLLAELRLRYVKLVD